MRSKYPFVSRFGLLSALLFSFNSSLFAAGSSAFENASYSAISISQGNAVTAQAEEPASISYNPAGIADLKGIQAQSNVGLIHMFTHATQRNSSELQSDSSLAVVPTAYFTINPGKVFNDRVVFGIGSDSPFGLANKYDSNNPAVRYTGAENWIKMYTLKPTVAWKATEWLSIAGGAMNYRMFDVGAVQAYPNSLAALVGAGGGVDGNLKAELSGSSWGWHLGAKIKPHPKHQLGFYFRSPVKVHLRGKVIVTGTNHALAGSGSFQTGAYSNMDLPMNMTWGYAYSPTPKTTVEADFGYTRWSTYNRLHIIATDTINAVDNGILRAIGTSLDFDYVDTYSIHLGGNHKLTDKLTLRAGSIFYTAAIPKGHFMPAIPDSNRLAFSVGASYQISKMLAVDLAAYNMIGLRRGVNNNISEAIGGSVDGKYVSNYLVGLISFRFAWEDVFDKMSGSISQTSSTDSKTA